MTLAQLLAFLGPFMPWVESALINVEDSVIQPELKKLIATVENVELKEFLTAIEVALDALIKAEIKKL